MPNIYAGPLYCRPCGRGLNAWQGQDLVDLETVLALEDGAWYEVRIEVLRKIEEPMELTEALRKGE